MHCLARSAAFTLAALAAPEAAAQIAPVTTQVGTGEAHHVALSGDGGTVLWEHGFLEAGAWLTALLAYDQATGAVVELARSPVPPVQHETFLQHGGLSADGRLVSYAAWLAYTGSGGGPVYQSQVLLLDRATGLTETISVTPTGASGAGSSRPLEVSADGRFVLFQSWADDLVPGDGTNSLDLFVRDRALATTTRVTETFDGQPPSSTDLTGADLSDDGQLVVWSSKATNYVQADTNARADVFLRHLGLGVTVRVSETPAGVAGDGNSTGPRLSGGGRFVAFRTSAGNLGVPQGDLIPDVVVKDLLTGSLVRASEDEAGSQASDYPTLGGLSDDGRFVAFACAASDLVPGDGNGLDDLFIKDLWSGVLRRAGLASDGSDTWPSLGGALSADGRWVAGVKATAADVGGWPCCSPAFLHDTRSGGPLLWFEGLSAGATATLRLSGAAPGAPLLVGWSLVGQGPTPSPWGLLDLGGPVWSFVVTPDGAGEVALPLGVPAVLVGWPLWVQGVDPVSGLQTAAHGGTVP